MKFEVVCIECFMMYDLFVFVFVEFGVEVRCICVSDFKENIFYVEIEVVNVVGEIVCIDFCFLDVLVFLLCVGVFIWVSEDVFECV